MKGIGRSILEIISEEPQQTPSPSSPSLQYTSKESVAMNANQPEHVMQTLRQTGYDDMLAQSRLHTFDYLQGGGRSCEVT